MIVYRNSKSNFIKDAGSGIEDIVREKVLLHLGIDIKAGSSEYNSWKNSLGNAMFHVMNTVSIPDDATVAIEYSIPRTKNRIDFLISGLSEHKKEQVVVIELKQWSEVALTGKDAIVKTPFQHGPTDTLHPSYQAWSYTTLLKNFNETVYKENIDLKPCAYLHNLVDPSVVQDKFYSEYTSRAPVFCKGDKESLQDYISKYIKYGDSRNTLHRIDSGNVRPSKELADSLVSMMRGNEEFILIDDQKLVYEQALSLAKGASTDKKQVFIIQGGPGTGKSVVAINLLVTLVKIGLNTHYITKNAAPRSVFEAKLTGSMRKSEISSLFQSSGKYIDAEPNDLDVAIVDEAHRLRAKSGLFYKGENQIKELINAAKVAIFFIDEDQQVTWQDIGETKEIERWASQQNAEVHHAKLESQFRCNGSDGYLAWVQNALQKRDTANPTLEGINYDFQVFDSPSEMREKIIEKNSTSGKARVVAGYCWNWISKKDKFAFDISLPEYNFEMQWNLTDHGHTYIINPDSINQVGCIHTCQGLELDYVGVIIGPDLIVRDGVVYTQPDERAKSDKSLHGYKKDLAAGIPGTENKADQIIKNTYMVLMTRGIKGCYIYCTDDETRDYFRKKY